jgi:hypothetical protein
VKIMELQSADLERLLTRLDALDAHIARSANAKQIGRNARVDAEDIVEELLVLSRTAKNLKDLELRIDAQKAIDFETLVRLHELLAALILPTTVIVSPQWTVDVPQTLLKLRQNIDDLRTQISKKSTLEIRVDVEMKIGSCVRHILIAAAKAQQSTVPIERLIESKVSLLADSQLRTAWAAVQSELDSVELSPLVGPKGVIPLKWRNFDTRKSVCRKYAAYVVNLKWKMISIQQQKGINAFSVAVHDVANIASWKNRDAWEAITSQESAFQKALGRIAECSFSLFGCAPEDFAGTLQISADSPLIRVERRLFENASEEDKTLPCVVYEMRKLIQLIDGFLAPEAQIEKALRQHKLGLEVVACDIVGEIGRKNELYLQRSLSRFLIERGIYAVGTKFGRGETDLVSNERSDYFILEVKKFTRGKSVTPRNLYAAIVQLQSYMDQHPAHPRGILVVYNLSETLLVAPQKWLRGKYWVAAVNLGKEPPSHRLKSMCVEEGKGDTTISVHWLGR